MTPAPLDVRQLAESLNELCEDPRNGFYAYGLARETLPVWDAMSVEDADALLSDMAADLLDFCRRHRREGR